MANSKRHKRAVSNEEAFDLVMEMMAIPGPSGQEGRVAEFVRKKLLSANADPKAIRFDNANRQTLLAGECGNLIFKLPGTVRGPRRMLMAHLDTVPICVGSRPKRKGNFVRSADPQTGLGADDRAGAAVVLHAAREILRKKLPHPPLTFLWTVQEEIGLQGARCVAVKSLGKPQLAFNFDGGSPDKLTIGATGGYRMTVEVRGIASHAGGAPELGVSAIAIAGLAIADLHRGGWHGDIQKDGRHGTSNIGVISGGEATNVVTDRVLLKIEARSHDATFRREIVEQIQAAFENAAQAVRNVHGQTGSVTFDGRLDYEAFRLSQTEPCVLFAQAAISRAGMSPQLAITNGGLDANWMVAHGIPTVTLGAGQVNQHMVTEALDVEKFLAATRVALTLAITDDET